MTKEISMANTLGARTARACDSCVRRRARVYCAADDAFLCAPCDSAVHSANPLARRHRRVPISPPSSASNSNNSNNSFPFMTISPSWNKRKPRTPRQKPINNVLKHEPMNENDDDQVPDLYQNSEEDYLSPEAGNEQLLYQVPVFEPELADLYAVPLTPLPDDTKLQNFDVSGVAGFQISETDLEEFAADMESLLGGPDQFDNFGGLMMDVEIEPEADVKLKTGRIEEDDSISRDVVEGTEKRRDRLMLSLDYEGVMAAWGCTQGGSPWTDGMRPRLGPDNCWPDFKGINGAIGPVYKSTTLTSEGREARVSRYREKRRTRLFAKKIRYEVRKLNAEKRPRMKGRFVKRAAMGAAAACQTVPIMKNIPMQLARPIGQGSFVKGHFQC